ncbi:Ig-like domain repeat protein, partial [Methanobrevibacter millerae]
VTALNVTVEQNTSFIINVADDFNGNVSIKVGDDVLYNGTVEAMVIGKVLSEAGAKVANVTFYGDSNYNVKTLDNVRFNVSRVDPTISVEITNVTYNASAVATINLGNNANGTVNVTVDGKVFNATVTNGRASVDLTGLSAGSKVASVEFFTTDKYNNNVTATGVFTINKNTSNITIQVESIYEVGDKIVINFTAENSTGAITVTINGKSYTVVANKNVTIDSAEFGEYIINAVLAGDENYTGSSANKTFNVIKHNITIEIKDITAPIYVGSEITIIAELNETVTGDVIFTINGANYTVHVSDDNKATYDYTPVNNKTLTVVATFVGNNKYNGNSTSKDFPVNMVPTNITVEFTTPISVGADAVITVRLNESINGTVKLTVGDKTYDVAVVNGTGTYTASNLVYGTYNINATFAGDVKYSGNHSTVKVLTVNKVPTNVTIKLDKDIIFVGENAVVSVVVNQTINTTVTVTVNNKNYTVGIVNGKGNLTLYDLINDTYKINATYAGDNKYVGNVSDTLTLKVNKIATNLIVVTNSPIKVGETAVVTINMNPAINTIVKLSLDGKEYLVAVVNGVGSYNVSGLNSGVYDVNVTYDSDGKYVESKNGTKLTVNNATLTADVIALNVTVEQNTSFIINVANDFNGNVSIKVGDKVLYNETVKNMINAAKLLAGDKVANVTFYGDSNYDVLTLNDVKFTVSRVTPTITVTINDVTYPADAVANINLGNNANGTVNITVGGKVFNATVTNGTATVNLDGLSAGDKVADVEFFANDDYNNNVTSTAKFTVVNANSTIVIEVNDVYVYNDTIIINLTTTGSNGTVSVTINGKSYPVNNKQVVIDRIAAGDYTIIAVLAGDGNYTAATNSTTFKVEKAGTSVSIDVKSVNVVDDTIVITLTTVNSTDLTVTVNGEVKVVSDNKITIYNAEAGDYVVNAILAGNENYTDSTDNATFVVNKLTPVVDVVDVTVVVDHDAVINVTGSADRNANLVVNINGVDYAVNMTNGNASLTVKGLSVGNYTVTVTYLENDKYVEAVASGWVNVTAKGSSAVVIDVNPVYSVDDSVVITVTKVNSSGNVTVTINGKEYALDKDNKITIDKAVNGTYVVVAVLDGDDDYYGSSATATFKVIKHNITISIDDIVAPIYVDSEITIVAELNETVTGDVVFTINGANYTAHVDNDNKTSVKYTPVNNETITVVATFLGNDKYNSNSTTKSFDVNRVPVAVTVGLDKTSIIVGESAVLSIDVDSTITGVVTVKVNGKDYNVAVVNGKGSLTLSDLANGTYTINATFAGDNKYEGNTSNTVSLVVKDKAVPDISVTVNETEGTAVIEVPADATGSVTVKIDGVEYDVIDITETPITVDIGDLMPGNHTIEVIYSGNDNYTSASDMESFNVPKAEDYNITVDAIVDENSVDIIVTLPENVTGPVLIDVDGVGYYANVTAGQAKLHLDNLTKGDHDVVVKYPGDDYYAPNGNVTSFTIDEKETQMKVDVEDGKIVIELPADATGDVTVTIDGENQTVPVVNGKAVVDISDLEPGKHTVNVTYPGDDKYSSVSDSTIVEVPKIVDYPFDVIAEDIKVGEKTNITINLPKDVNGNVLVDIGGIGYSAPVTDGVAHVELPLKFKQGTYNVTVTLSRNDRYEDKTVMDSFTVYPAETSMDVKVEDGKVIVELPEDATGNVTVKIDGVEHVVPVEDGKAVVDISDLEPGKHAVEVTYSGDDKYASVSNVTVIDIPKETDYPLTVSEEDGKIVVDVPDDATGYVTVTIDGKDYVVPIKDGGAVIDLPSDLGPGEHTVDVSYPGDGKYAPVNNSTTVDVPKVDVTEEDGKLVIELPEDAKGNVTVTIDGVNQTVPIVDGKAVVDVPSDLEPGNHTV